MNREREIPRLDIMPSLHVLQQYAAALRMPFATYFDKLKVLAHYKNFGSQSN